jgi:hypothetical protein
MSVVISIFQYSIIAQYSLSEIIDESITWYISTFVFWFLVGVLWGWVFYLTRKQIKKGDIKNIHFGLGSFGVTVLLGLALLYGATYLFVLAVNSIHFLV